MSMTRPGRDDCARSLALKYLNELAIATRDFAPADSERWLSPYALGFATSHVALAAQIAQTKFAFAMFQKWPRPDDISPWIYGLIPQGLGLDGDRFRAAFEPADREWKTADATSPINIGGGMGRHVLAASLARFDCRLERDYFSARVSDMDMDLRHLRAPKRLHRLLQFRPSADIYRYLVMRTLGHEVFDVTRQQADASGLNGV